MRLEQVRAWAREASEIALHYYNAVAPRHKPGGSFVTDADIEIERLLRAKIKQAYPHHGIIGEEGQNDHVSAEYLWAIDPIDGTGLFVDGLPGWGISIGLLHHAHPVLGCFYLPLVDEWYEADLEGPALFNGHPVTARDEGLLDINAWIAVPSNIHRRYQINYPGKVRSLGSMAAAVCYVARGNAAGALIGRSKIWDIAAGLALLERAGGGARLLHSRAPLDLRTMLRGESAPEPVVVGSPAALELLLNRVRVVNR